MQIPGQINFPEDPLPKRNEEPEPADLSDQEEDLLPEKEEEPIMDEEIPPVETYEEDQPQDDYDEEEPVEEAPIMDQEESDDVDVAERPIVNVAAEVDQPR